MDNSPVKLSDTDLLAGGTVFPGLLHSPPATQFSVEGYAQIIADHNAIDDPEWSYTVRKIEDKFIIVVSDEDGNEMGAL